MAAYPIVLEDTEFKFLNFNRVLCLSPHPDDVEYAMLGSMIKFKNTQFDIIVISQGGDFDETSNVSRHKECESILNLNSCLRKKVKKWYAYHKVPSFFYNKAPIFIRKGKVIGECLTGYSINTLS